MYSRHLTTSVGPKQYTRLSQAAYFYKLDGFEYVDAPWLIQQKVSHATKPPTALPIHHHVRALNHTFHFAASGEQSFLQMQYDAMKNGGKITGRYQTITPCFRDEQKITDTHRIGFMKLELIDWDESTPHNLHNIIKEAHDFFSQFVECRVIENDQRAELGHDIVSRVHGIELGSYGIRSAKIGDFPMAWIYGTGLAEPRLSYAIEKERNGRA